MRNVINNILISFKNITEAFIHINIRLFITLFSSDLREKQNRQSLEVPHHSLLLLLHSRFHILQEYYVFVAGVGGSFFLNYLLYLMALPHHFRIVQIIKSTCKRTFHNYIRLGPSHALIFAKRRHFLKGINHELLLFADHQSNAH